MTPVHALVFPWILIALGWILLVRNPMAEHENLQAVASIIIVWGVVIATVYLIEPQEIIQATLLTTVAAVAFSIPYFWRKREKYEFVISFEQEPEQTRVRTIQVVLGPNEERTTEARLYTFFVSIPKHSKSAEDVHFCYRPVGTQTLLRLKTIPSTPNPTMRLRWTTGTREQFDQHVDSFATALNDAEERRLSVLNLPAGGLRAPFVLCLAYPSSDALYFPSVSQWALPLGARYQIELWVQATGRPEKKLKTFFIDARSWNNVSFSDA